MARVGLIVTNPVTNPVTRDKLTGVVASATVTVDDIVAADIRDKAISTAKLADESVTADKIDPDLVEKINSAMTLPLGSIILSNRLDVPEGMLAADGLEWSKAQFPEFYALIQDNKVPRKTYEQWQAEYDANQGNVGYYAYDPVAETFKMIRLSGAYFKSVLSGPGSYVPDGLPNIKGEFSDQCLTQDYGLEPIPVTKGALYASKSDINYNASGSTGYGYKIVLDASKSNDIYSDLNLGVTPKSVNLRAFVQVYTGVIDDGTSNVQAVISAIDGKIATKVETDLSNVTTEAITASGEVNATPDFVIESWVASDGNSFYRKYKNGWIEQGGRVSSETTSGTVTYPHAFSTNVISIQICNKRPTPVSMYAYHLNGTPTTTSFGWFCGSGTITGSNLYWTACGF